MKRERLTDVMLTLTFLLFSMASPCAAQTVEERVLTSLKTEGYTRIVRLKTFLGRTRIVALRAGHIREVVINPTTNEILRDVELVSEQIPDYPSITSKPESGSDE